VRISVDPPPPNLASFLKNSRIVLFFNKLLDSGGSATQRDAGFWNGSIGRESLIMLVMRILWNFCQRNRSFVQGNRLKETLKNQQDNFYALKNKS